MHTRNYPLAETPDFLLAALERTPDAVVIVDSDLRVSHFNAAAELIWGKDRAEVLGCHVSRLGLRDLQPRSDADLRPDEWRRRIQEKSQENPENRKSNRKTI